MVPEVGKMSKDFWFEVEDVLSGDCVGREPVVTVIRDRQPDDSYPQTAEEYEKPGLNKVEQTIAVECSDYHRLIALGAPVLACAGCPRRQ